MNYTPLLIFLSLLANIVLAGTTNDCSRLYGNLADSYLRPNFMRENLMSKEYNQILVDWKAGSPKANALANDVAARQLRELGIHSSYGFTINPSDLPKPKFGSEIALLHPRMKEYIEKANAQGISIVIDPQMAVASDDQMVRGIFSPSRNSIRLLPNSTWDVFMHEYQHMQFFKLGLRSPYPSFNMEKLTAEDAKIVNAAKKLYAKGYSGLAVDETLAVKEEIKTLERMGYVPWSKSVYEARKYAWSFQEKDIEAGKVKDKLAGVKITAKKIFLHPWLVWPALGLSARSIVLHNDELKTLIVLHEDGNVEKYNVSDGTKPD